MSAGLEIRDLQVRYGRASVLQGVDLPPLAPGRLVGLLGRNAAGKSTLLKAIAGLVRCSGRAVFRTVDLPRATPERRLALVGYLPQTPPQASRLLVWELATAALRATSPGLGTDAAEARVLAALRRFDLDHHALRPVDALSGGRRQLLGLAIVLARRVPLLLLDEPTSALDLRWKAEALDAVRDACRQGATALVALHDIDLALGVCDEVVVLGGGRVLGAGAPEAVMDAELLRRAFDVSARLERLPGGRTVILVDRACDARGNRKGA